MRRFLLLLLPCFGCVTAPVDSVEHPNIVWISVEDLSPRLGSYGDSVARTPVLDKLASEGMRFTRAFTSAGVCAPSRSAIITGMYQNSIGTHHMRTSHEAEGLPTPYEAVPPPYVKGFPEYLRANGYYCTNRSKTDYQFGLPATIWDESGPSAHWRARAADQPFFAVFNFTTTHESQVWPKPGKALETDPSTVEVPPYYPDTPAIREDLARHYDNIAHVDQQAGEILRQLEEDGLSEKTVVVFWSDHGDGLPRAKRWLYDSGIHVPLIVRWPGKVAAGSVNETLVSLIDLAPTMLSIAGVEIPSHLQGSGFLGAEQPGTRRYIYAARDRIDESYDWVRAVRDSRFKLIRNFYPEKPYILPVPYRDRGVTMQELLRLHAEGGLDGPQLTWFQSTRAEYELYDLENDRFEIENLASDPEYLEVFERLKAELDAWMERVHDRGSTPEREMVNQMWPGGVQPMTGSPLIEPDGGTFDEQVQIILSAPTVGSSIAYTFEEGDGAHWNLYSRPLILDRSVTLRAKAIRYGYRESPEVRAGFTIGG